MTDYWIAVVSKEHAMQGVEGGFIQINHGKEAPLKRIKKNDWIIIYSPKLSMETDVTCQAFTAIGQATDDRVYQVQMTDTFAPFRRGIQFHDCQEIPIKSLIERLGFIHNKKSWGAVFRFGFFAIQENDFNLIKSEMLPNENKG